MSDRFVFGPFELDVPAFRLCREGAGISVQPKALELLIVVVRAGGELVDHAHLRSELWPDVVVTEQSLRQVLLKLRQSLGEHQDWVQTVPRKGLRYAGPPVVTVAVTSASDAVKGAAPATRPLASASQVPAERDRFVGRGPELAALDAKHRAGVRLVTVLGPGGVGKTRLAARFARAHLADWPGGAWFCDLSTAWTLDGLLGAVADAFGLCLDAGDPVARLGHGIAHRGEALIVFDNFEQVAGYAQETIGRWLDGAPSATFLVTSRSALGVVGEHVLTLAPLPPDDAAALFAERSSAADAPVSPDDPAVRSLVGLLDHLPLAIELAAARGRVLSPARLVERISERFDLLKSTTRTDRHATLRATLDWSWDLSSPAERAALAQLVVFEGQAGLAAAEAVVEAGAPPLDVLEALVDRSWVRRVGDDRFELLGTVRAYAGEKLAAADRHAAEVRHGRWYAALPVIDAPAHLANLVAAVERAVAREDGELAAPLLDRAWHVIELRGPFPLGLALATAVSALPLPAEAAGRVALAAGTAARLCGRGSVARTHLGAALEAGVGAGDRGLEASALVGLAVLDAQEGRVHTAEPILRSALTIRRDLGDRVGEAQVLHDLAGIAMHRGALADAEASLRAALELLRTADAARMEARVLGSLTAVLVAGERLEDALQVGDAALAAHGTAGSRRGESVALRNLGNAYAKLGRHERALSCYDGALAIAGELGDLAEEGVILANIGNVRWGMGHAVDARAQFDRALRIARQVSDPAFEGWILGRLGRFDAAEGRHLSALAQFDAAEALLVRAGHARALDEVRAHRAEAVAASGRGA
ncbi:MAG: tetratricopeptide repeat protein [Myxococcota bacterium]